MGSQNSSYSDSCSDVVIVDNLSDDLCLTPDVDKVTGIYQSCKNTQSLFRHFATTDTGVSSQPTYCMKCLFEKFDCQFVNGVERNDYLAIKNMRHPKLV